MNAPTAKFDLKKANATQLNDHLNALQAKAADHNTPDAELDKVHQEITATFAAIRNLKKTRSAELDGIKAKQDIFGFSIKEIFGDDALNKFSDHELTLEAQSRGLFKAKAADGETKTRKASTTNTYASDNNPIFIKVPKAAVGKGPATEWIVRQDRVNEHYKGTKGPIFVTIPKGALMLKGKDVQETEKNLSAHIQAESAEFAKSAKGKEQLTKIATELFNFVPPKAKNAAAEPHNEAQADMNKAAA